MMIHAPKSRAIPTIEGEANDRSLYQVRFRRLLRLPRPRWNGARQGLEPHFENEARGTEPGVLDESDRFRRHTIAGCHLTSFSRGLFVSVSLGVAGSESYGMRLVCYK